MNWLSLLLGLVCHLSYGAESTTLTLRSALTLTENRAEEIRTAIEEVGAAQSEVGRSSSALLPTISAQSTILSHQVIAQWSLINNRIWATRKLANQLEKTARLKLELTKQDLRILLVDAYYKACQAKQISELGRTTIDQYRKIHRVLELANHSHLIEKSTFVLSRTNLRAVESEQRNKLFALEQSLRLLGFYTGTAVAAASLPAPPDLATRFNEVANLSPYAETGLRTAYNQAISDQTRTSKEIQMSTHYPELLGVASYGFGQESPARSVFNTFALGGRVGLYITIPLFSGLSSFSERNEWNHKIAMTEIQVQRSKRDFAREIEARLQSARFIYEEVKQLKPQIDEARDYWNEIHSAPANGAMGLHTWMQTGNALNVLEARYLDLVYRGVTEVATIKVLLGRGLDL